MAMDCMVDSIKYVKKFIKKKYILEFSNFIYFLYDEII